MTLKFCSGKFCGCKIWQFCLIKLIGGQIWNFIIEKKSSLRWKWWQGKGSKEQDKIDIVGLYAEESVVQVWNRKTFVSDGRYVMRAAFLFHHPLLERKFLAIRRVSRTPLILTAMVIYTRSFIVTFTNSMFPNRTVTIEQYLPCEQCLGSGNSCAEIIIRFVSRGRYVCCKELLID